MNSGATFWNKAAKKYATRTIDDPEFYDTKLTLTRRCLTPESDVLEFGCGTGSTALLHAPYAKHITAIDYSSEMIAIARSKLNAEVTPNLEFICTTLDDQQFDGHGFDAILGLNVLHLIDDYSATIRRAHVLLKPGGYFVTSSACLASNWMIRLLIPVMRFIGKAPPLTYFSAATLESAMTGNGFRVVERLSKGDGLFLIAEKTNAPTTI